MANSDLILSKLRAKYADGLTTSAGNDFGTLWRLWTTEVGGTGYLTNEALLNVYGGSGTFADREFAYWNAYNPGTTGLGKFTVENVNTIDNTANLGFNGAGFYTVTGSGGGASGNDRRLYRLNGSNFTDCEVRLTFDGSAQHGIALRGQTGGPAVIIWNNIVFAATGNVLIGVWEYNGTTLLSTNQNATSSSLWGLDVVSIVAAGGTATVRTKAPSLVSAGSIIDFNNTVGGFGSVTVGKRIDADTFSFPTSTLGTFSGGNFRWTIAPGARTLAVRAVGNQITVKQWLVDHPEPSWSDPLRTVTATLPATLASSGLPPPASGWVGFVAAHLGSSGNVGVKSFSAVTFP